MTDDEPPTPSAEPDDPRRDPRGVRPTADERMGRARAGDARCSPSSTAWRALLDRSDLTELEVEAGGTGLVLRKPMALAPVAAAAARRCRRPRPPQRPARRRPRPPGRDASAPQRPAVGEGPAHRHLYGSPAPGSAPYVAVGGEVAVGQVIGLIEAMKLFNEIKSDLAGRVVRVVAGERRARQGQAAAHRGGTAVNDAHDAPARSAPTSPAGAATRRPRC